MEEKEIPEKIKELVKKIEELSVVELAQLVKILEEKFGITPAQFFPAPATTAQAPTPAEGGGKRKCSVFLTQVGEKKIEVIKVIKEITAKGLKECKDFVDAVASSPQLIKENIEEKEAEEIKKKLEEVGAKVEIK